MTRAITVRPDEADHITLRKQAERLRVRPGTLARMLVHAGLSGDAPAQGRSEAHAALVRLVRRSHQHPARRGGLGERRPCRSRRRAVSVVLDAYVLVALLIADERQTTVRSHVEEWLDVGEELHAPAALPYEVTNVLARLVFKGALKVNDVTEIWQDLATFDLQLHPFDLTHDGPEVAAIIAQLRRRHATYSTYVCLARRFETTLWTLDAALARNAAPPEPDAPATSHSRSKCRTYSSTSSCT